MASRRRWWYIYGACALTLIAALTWISLAVLRLEKAEHVARAVADQQEAVRLALWRMDSWITPHLAVEAARPYFEYQSFYRQDGRAGASDAAMVPSPLLTFRSPYIRFHFQLAPDGVLTSPQAPDNADRALAPGLLNAETLDANRAQLQRFRDVLVRELRAGGRDEVMLDELGAVATPDDFAAVEAEPTTAEEAQQPAKMQQSAPTEAQQLRSQAEFVKRKGAVAQNLAAADAAVPTPASAPTREGVAGKLEADGAPVTVSPFVPMWLDRNDGEPELVFHRRAILHGGEYVQGFVCDWPRMSRAMIGEISDLLADASLSPSSHPRDAASGMMLASVPATLSYAAPDVTAIEPMSPARIAIGLTWLAVAMALVAVAITLRSSIAFGERRSRFASAVTHELRTPLTSFQMYTEMLADGMVKSKEKTQEYLRTLKSESARLATLVENVLSYARLEEGRRPTNRRCMSVDDLIERVSGPLARRAADGGMALVAHRDEPPAATVDTDADAVGQILLNLVDNACKYAREGVEPAIELTVAASDRWLEIDVLDHGGGIRPEDARWIFAPFRRGRDGGADQPGIGLGLALSRGLARDLGGDLCLVDGAKGGARFRLRLPLLDRGEPSN